MDTLKIDAIETDCGFYLKHSLDASYNSSASSLLSYLFDGKKGEKTHHRHWLRVEKFPILIQKEERQPNINHRYVLIDEKLFPNLPKVLKKDEVFSHRDDETYTDVWKEPYKNLSTLYNEFSDSQPNILVSIPFEINIICKLDKIKEYAGFSYPVQKTTWAHEGFYNLTQEAVQHYAIDEIVFPDIILTARTSFLSSKDTYKIIRKYVQDNINPKYAVITSDYDFCFTVKKKIRLAKPKEYQKDVSSLRSRKSKYVTAYIEYKEIQIFEMTNEKDNYKGYTPIKGFIGKDLEDLKKNIETYLKNLIDKINEPVVECLHCSGSGVILEQIK
jgi:hypothetical protein